ncbi:hypothetical protein [Clostridium akagii]|uniref:hypothetical protein n=1 Tax=Clostridium akagii TaxID=91623 RepID=UPI00047E951B|nr:hypothetical protein [Clostridium akagii]
MAISKDSVRIQFTLNITKEKEKQIADFLNECINQNNSIKEIIYNYIVSNSGVKSPRVTYIENTKSDEKILKVAQSDDIKLDINNKVTKSEGNLLEKSELEINELEELNKFI